MEQYLVDAYSWFERNATIVAGIEFALLVVFWPGKMLLTCVLERGRRKHAARIEAGIETLLQRHQELMDLRSVLANVKMGPLGESARVGRLPDGTNLVELPNGQLRLTLPVRLSATFSGGLDGRLSGGVTKDEDGVGAQ